jgi:hypothetical protein
LRTLSLSVALVGVVITAIGVGLLWRIDPYLIPTAARLKGSPAP